MIAEQEVWSERTRTLSSDSGCDVLLEPLGLYSHNLEIIVKRWQTRLVKVVQQETNRAEKVTQWATEALKNCDEGDKLFLLIHTEFVLRHSRTSLKLYKPR